MNAQSSSQNLPRFLRVPRVTLQCVAIPYALATVGCLLARPEIGAFVAPLLGPWGGVPFGHSECTMASALPGPSAFAVGWLALSLLLSWFLRATPSSFLRIASHTSLALAATCWCALAWFSAANSTS
ncbi:MAG: hypothetical protein NTV21_13800 [Planctomycetota bacterium]|nr:hypothetical protein [Planctomycetota bacterium]